MRVAASPSRSIVDTVASFDHHEQDRLIHYRLCSRHIRHSHDFTRPWTFSYLCPAPFHVLQLCRFSTEVSCLSRLTSHPTATAAVVLTRVHPEDCEKSVSADITCDPIGGIVATARQSLNRVSCFLETEGERESLLSDVAFTSRCRGDGLWDSSPDAIRFQAKVSVIHLRHRASRPTRRVWAGSKQVPSFSFVVGESDEGCQAALSIEPCSAYQLFILRTRRPIVGALRCGISGCVAPTAAKPLTCSFQSRRPLPRLPARRGLARKSPRSMIIPRDSMHS